MFKETQFKIKVQRDLDEIDAYHVKTNERALRGIPDIIGCRNGYFFALELKKDATSKIDNLQTYVIRQILKKGGFARVTYPEKWESDLAALIQYTDF